MGTLKEYRIKLKGSDPTLVKAESLTALDALKKLNVKRIEDVVAVRLNGEVCDLNVSLDGTAELEPVYIDSSEGLEILPHRTSHVMAMAVKELFPGVKVT
ncbi:MAG: threonine--tRNA ligase, partial [Deltaproteobacteria bacterium]